MDLKPGTRLAGRYDIISTLGAGGMGVVYRALDVRLAREVAIKLLTGQSGAAGGWARLAREATVLASLSHPNIVTIHDFSTDGERWFVVMELLEGETLRSLLARSLPTPERLLEIARAITEGLAAAHARGIIHRDLKPDNVFLLRDGSVKILDFGLARTGEGSASEPLTRPGMALGTLHYMSPEQLRGLPLGPTTDVFALGSLLFEMLAGQRPFARKADAETIGAILEDGAPLFPRGLPGIPPGLPALVDRCLARRPEQRFADASAALQALRSTEARPGRISSGSLPTLRVSLTPARRWDWQVLAVLLLAGVGALVAQQLERRARPDMIDSIAVLPLRNDSPEADAEYLSDGLSESVTNSLAQLPDLRVIAHSAALRYRGRTVDRLEVGRELHVSAILVGRVNLRGESLGVHVDLIEVDSGQELWAGEYQRPLADVLTLESDIAHQVARRLRPRLTGEQQQRMARRMTEDVEAFKLYLRGRFQWNKRTGAGLERASEYFQQAIEHDPAYALAYSGLADCYALESIYGGWPTRESFPKARAAAQKALEIDDGLAEAHATLAWVRFRYDWDLAAAEQEFQWALVRDPDYATAQQWYGLQLAAAGRFSEAYARLRRAQDLDPLSPIIQADLGLVLFYGGRLDDALRESKRLLQMEPGFSRAHSNLVRILEVQGHCEEAARAVAPVDAQASTALLASCAAGGMRGYWESKLRASDAALARARKPDYLLDFERAVILAALGRNAAALDVLERAHQEQSYLVVWLAVQPQFAGLRGEPRFQELVREVGLSPHHVS